MVKAAGDAELARSVRISVIGRRLSVVAIALAIAVAAQPARLASADSRVNDPLQQTRSLVERALAILNNPKLSLTEERQQLRALAEPHFDFDGMARLTLGYHWKSLTPEQRAAFAQVFKAFIEDVYLDQIQNYYGQNVDLRKETPLGPGYAEVQGQVVQKQAQPIDLSIRLRQVDGRWKIYDVTVDNISITANYRNQFNRVINAHGFPALLTALHQKQTKLAQLLGKKS